MVVTVDWNDTRYEVDDDLRREAIDARRKNRKCNMCEDAPGQCPGVPACPIWDDEKDDTDGE